MKIYGLGQSRSFRAIWAAEEAGVEYDFIELEFGSSAENGNQGSAYKKLNPQGKVPTLVDDDLIICESGAIVNYLATKAPKMKLMPADGTVERARYDEMCFFVLTELEQPLWSNGKHRFALPEQYRVPEILTKTLDFEYAKAQSALLKLRGDAKYAAGNNFTMADILLTHTISWAELFKFKVEKDLLEYKTRIEQRVAFKNALKKVKTTSSNDK